MEVISIRQVQAFCKTRVHEINEKLYEELPTQDRITYMIQRETFNEVLKFIGEAKPFNKETCQHTGWNFAQHGRCCFQCGTFMVDFGD